MIHSTIPSYKGLKSVDLDNLGTNFCFISYLIQLSHDLKKLCVCRHFFKEDCFFLKKRWTMTRKTRYFLHVYYYILNGTLMITNYNIF